MDLRIYVIAIEGILTIMLGALVVELYRQFGVMYLMPPEEPEMSELLKRGQRLPGPLRAYEPGSDGSISAIDWPSADPAAGRLVIIAPVDALVQWSNELTTSLPTIASTLPWLEQEIIVCYRNGIDPKELLAATELATDFHPTRVILDKHAVVARSTKVRSSGVAYLVDGLGWIAAGVHILDGTEVQSLCDSESVGVGMIRPVTRAMPLTGEETSGIDGAPDGATGVTLRSSVERYLDAYARASVDDIERLLAADVVFKIGNVAVRGSRDVIDFLDHEIFRANIPVLKDVELDIHGTQCFVNCRLSSNNVALPFRMRFTADQAERITLVEM